MEYATGPQGFEMGGLHDANRWDRSCQSKIYPQPKHIRHRITVALYELRNLVRQPASYTTVVQAPVFAMPLFDSTLMRTDGAISIS